MVEVIVIGTEPPCLRCSLLVQRVNQEAEGAGIEVQVRKMDCRSSEAQALARQRQRGLGTAKDVAREGTVEVDWNRVAGLLKQDWSPDLDGHAPCQEKADHLNMWMTPVLIVNGKVKHHGSVPRPVRSGPGCAGSRIGRIRAMSPPVHLEAFIGEPPCPSCQSWNSCALS